MAGNTVEIKVTADAAQAVKGLADVASQLNAAGNEGKQSAGDIDKAWRTLGVKAFTDVSQQIKKVNEALDTVRANSKNPIEIKAATEAASAKIKSLEDGVKQTSQATSGLGDAFSKLGPIVAAAFTGQELVQTIASAESLKLGLTAITGSSQAAAAELAFLKKTSNELGLELQSAGQQYLSLTAATKGTTLEGEQTRQVFTAVSRAMSVLGKSSAETQRALQAVSQMASKGTVSMEELRGQLGEALPGALKAAADGAGITTTSLIKMVENGDVLAKDLLPALAKGLDTLYASGGPPDTLIANWNRFKNVITETAIALGEGGAGKALSGILGFVSTTLVGASEAALLAGKGIGEFAGAIATGTTSAFTLGAALDESANRINKVKGAFEGTTPAAAAMGNAVEKAGEQSVESFRKSEIAAQNATASVLQNRNAYTELEESAKRRIEVAEKAVKASEAEAKLINLVAAAFGSETEKRQAALLASQQQTNAVAALVVAKRQELDVATQKLAQIVNETRGMKELDEASKKQKETAEQAVKVKTEELKTTQAQGAAYAITTAQLKAQTDAVADNSSRVYELRAAMIAATEAAANKRAEFEKGKATIEQVTAAELAAKNATYLYRDALNDLVTSLKLKESAIGQQAATQQKEIELTIEERTTTLELAKARGDDAAAARAQTLLTQASVDAKRQSADASRAEAQAIRDTAQAEENAASAAGNLTTEKKAQIEAMRESAKQKDLDAQKTDELAFREERLAKATQDTAAAMERAAEAERKRLNVDKDGFSLDKNGNRVAQLVENQRSIYEKAKSQGLTDAQSLEISDTYVKNGQLGGFTGGRFAAEKGETIYTQIQKAIDEKVLANAAANARAAKTSTTPAATTQTYVVKLDIGNGQTRNINVASANDAQALIRALQDARLTAA